MGNLVTMLKGGGGGALEVDFEHCEPSAREQATYAQVQEVLQHAPYILQSITDYVGCQDLARKAMSSPTPENELEAFEGLLPVVDAIGSYYTFARSMEETIPITLLHLAKGPTDEAKDSIDEAIAKQLADIFNFTLQFDTMRMMRPHLSNDFSYYRRLLPKFGRHPHIKVKDDEASGMALFTAEHIPMLGAAVKGSTKAIAQNPECSLVLSAMANGCNNMIRNKKFESEETNLFCARAMTGAIVLFDHVDPVGSFSKRSPIATKSCINTLKKEFPKEGGLLNAIQYSTKHFNDETTPAAIAALFDQ